MKYVLVTTEFRGVFAGEMHDEAQQDSKTVTLRKARNIIYWSGKRGFLGLAATGPDPESKLGDTADEITLQGVTSVAVCSEQAQNLLRKW